MMIKLLIVCSFLGMGTAWIQQNSCSERTSRYLRCGDTEYKEDIKRIRETLETYLPSINTFLERLATDCGLLTSPENGLVTVSGTTLGSTAYYSCNAGFTLMGLSSRMCGVDGYWSGEAPVCRSEVVDCGPLTSPENGLVSVTGTTLGSSAYYSCNASFVLLGSSSRVCAMNGSWSGEAPVCEFVDCGPLTSPENGLVSVSGTTLGSSAYYSCNASFVLMGSYYRTCGVDGSWSGEAPVCEALTCTNPGDLRLVSGANDMEGRVEVCYNNTWGTVCDDLWDITDANVACRQLGFFSAINATTFGQGTGAILLDNLGCTGNESRLIDCPHNGIGNNDCGHHEDAGVVCLSSSCTSGDLRLVGGFNYTEGRVEVCYNNTWGTVCDDSWDITDGHVACRQLGFSGVTSAPGYATFGQGTGDIFLVYLRCTGNESRLIDCPHNGIGYHSCSHSEDAGVVCASTNCGPLSFPENGYLTVSGNVASYSCNGAFALRGSSSRVCGVNGSWSGDAPVCEPFLCTSGDLRLVGGANDTEGRVEVCNDNNWGTVCDDSWDITDANVVCRQLGFPSAISAPVDATFGQGMGIIVLDEINCTGTERRLIDCPHNGVGITDCAHDEDAGVVCAPVMCTNGDLRLVGGYNYTEGRVEVCYNNTWGTVCDDSWDINDGHVACRQLGFSGVTSAPGYASFGQGTGLIFLDYLRCTGNESRLIDCPHRGIGYHSCSHMEDAGVVCASTNCGPLSFPENGYLTISGNVASYSCNGAFVLRGLSSRVCGVNGSWSGDAPVCEPFLCTSGDLRLVGGANDTEGRVEVCNDNNWGTVCDDSWDITDANVVCRQLGFPSAISAPVDATFGQGTGTIVLDKLNCTGTERRLIECPHNGVGITDCGHDEDAGVVCEPVMCTNGDLRLVGGYNYTEGRVEVCYNNTWGTVCDDSWDINDGHVACRQLGFSSAISAPGYASFGQGTGEIFLDYLRCSGNESRLIDCPHRGIGTHYCSHSEDAGVVCASLICTNGDLRLVGGANYTEGRVEVCYNNTWGTVCDDSWDIDDGRVACRQLGFSAVASAPGNSTFGQGSGAILLDDLGCTGIETRLIDCPHRGIGSHDCGHSEDAGVMCTCECFK